MPPNDGRIDNPKRRDRGEPSIAELLSDPVTQALMEADGVNPVELEAMLRRVAASVAGRQALPEA
jgi:hypothetical protein